MLADNSLSPKPNPPSAPVSQSPHPPSPSAPDEAEPDPETVPGYAPDFIAEPDLGDKIDLSAAFDRQYEQIRLGYQTVIGDQVAVYGQSAEEPNPKEDQGQASAAVAMVSLSSGQPVWDRAVDLGEATGLASPYLSSLTLDAAGSILIACLQDPYNQDAPVTYVMISPVGEVLGTAAPGAITAGEYLVTWDDAEVRVARTASPDAELWRAAVYTNPWGYPGYGALAGPDAVYVLSAEGFRSASDGRPLGWAQSQTVTYAATAEGWILRLTGVGRESGGSVMRIDPDGGAELWAAEVPADLTNFYTASADGAIVMADADRLTALDPDSGEARWSVPHSITCARPLVMADGSLLVLNNCVPAPQTGLAVFSAADGAERFHSDAGLGQDWALGGRVFYTAAEDALVAYDLEDGGATLWRLPIDGADVFAAQGKLFVESGGFIQQVIRL
jgi:outer membrane protein assembly factor BamB